TGFMMWNPLSTVRLLPGEFIPAAKAAHGGEALLAVLAIILWHFYHVHLRHLNKSIFTGKMTRPEMEEEHPAELALIEAGRTAQEPSPVVLRRRQQIFYPIASVIVIVSGILLLGFITFEKTAIETVPPPITGEAFVPYTPTPTLVPSPTSTPLPTPSASGVTTGPAWDTTISALFNAKCAGCHVNASLGNLSLKTYADALKGGKSGPAIVPSDPAKSMLVQVQQKGGHPGTLSADELAQVIMWIEAGAPEKSGAPELSGAATPPTSSAAEGWTGGIDQLVNAKCAACHVNTATADLSLKTYADALKGGKSGPAVVPNDPAKSVLVQVQQKGGHPGQLTPEELDRVVKWIEAGAPEVTSTTGAVPTPTPGIKVKSWTDAFAIFTAKCTMCHINVQAGNLSLKTYQDALKGGQSGPAIVPGDPDKSVLVTTQQGTDHPSLGKLTPEELAALIAWIKAGAPEVDRKTWATVSAIFTAKCTMCHIDVQAGNLSLKTYADALKGGQSGPAIVPGDPAQSVLVTTQQGTAHPSLGRLTPEELADIIAWIEAGAPEK
ncbi:MAG TPA: c-type cytochrome domain-containing protein, partial [Anaerolineae bacterium]|nr:c-type cytochrome domain-containing protein [Anaerolineae bacterium]